LEPCLSKRSGLSKVKESRDSYWEHVFVRTR